MFSNSTAMTNAAVSTAPQASGPRGVDEVIERLAGRASVGQRKWAPDNTASSDIRQLGLAADQMTVQQKTAVESKLAEELRRKPANPLDARLLQDVVHYVLQSGSSGSPDRYLAQKAFDGLALPSLKLRETGEAEPNSRTFNSTLPSFAESTYDYGPLGRTLLWQGACQLFSGPARDERSRRLEKVIFSFPNPPEPGKPKLEGPMDFITAVDALNVYEPVDVNSLRDQQNGRQPT
ncbi:hypothetical protein KZJ38_30665 [Paraburkholderia edwinii]|uniref:Uncharacterized protein n=1 Tax=Paraburkholderia edwinii TaxID=2861782 RepID=A0ABX8UR73_9BURK|nr:hypothetical protein [Paraburkholderia edwinii]QYD71389.1 hypothetical protein KZJ38_30665 [Paraburkholderia edwinii]